MEANATMKPWEQHHAVISMPRFAYNPASMMKQSAGFLVTCSFRREKSATKEVLALIQEYLKLTAKDVRLDNPVSNSIEKNGQPAEVEQAPLVSVVSSEGTFPPSSPNEELGISSGNSEVLETGRGTVINGTDKNGQIDNKPAEVEQAPPGAVLSSVETLPLSCPNEDLALCSENLDILETGHGAGAEDSISEEAGRTASEGKVRREGHDGGMDQAFSQSGGESSSHGEEALALNTFANDFTLVKLATMGVIYICAHGKHPSTVLNVASRLLKDVQAGAKAAPQWCHRLVPVQATCSMKREELHGVISQMVKDHLRDQNIPSGDQPLNYAVAFNRRGADVAKESLEETYMLGRDQCIKIVTAAVEEVITPVRVDLTTPKMVVIVELIPVAGAQSCLMCAVSVLPGDLTVSKPKLNIKPLAPLHPKSKKRKHQKESLSNA